MLELENIIQCMTYWHCIWKYRIRESPEFSNIVIMGCVTFLIICQKVIKTIKCKNCPDVLRCWVQLHVQCLPLMAYALGTLTPDCWQEMYSRSVYYYYEWVAMSVVAVSPRGIIVCTEMVILIGEFSGIHWIINRHR